MEMLFLLKYVEKIPHQNWTSVSMNFLYSVTLKSIDLSSLLKNLLHRHDFVASYISHLENSGSQT